MKYLPSQLAAFAERLEHLYGTAERQRILETMTRPKRVGLWCNPLRAGALCGATRDRLPGQPLEGLPGLRWVSPAERDALVSGSPAKAGVIYPMNPASALAPLLLAPQPGEEILDLAAAPGGKTLVMAGLMENRGRIAAVEPIKARFHRMRANLERCGVAIVQSYLADGRSIGRKVPERFDRVLLDAPCSSEARIRLGEPASYAHWAPRKVRETSRKQRGLIRSAFRALKPGGQLLYCTCAYAIEENEGVVHYLLEAEPAARVLPLADAVAAALPAAQETGRALWLAGMADRLPKPLNPRVQRAVRILPNDLWDGFFLCLIAKDATAAV